MGAHLVLENLEKLSQCVVEFKWMAQVAIRHDLVVIASTDPGMGEAACFFKFMHNSLHGALGDSYLCSDLALANVGVAADRNQNMGVVCKELPRGLLGAKAAHGRIEFHAKELTQSPVSLHA